MLAEFESVYGYAGEIPVPVEEIADSLARLRVLDADDMSHVQGAPTGARKLSGMLLCGPKRIYVSALEAHRAPGRRRFTIAHELGHWYLHADQSSDGQYQRFCRGPDLRSRTSEEGEANEFAAALLMPRELLAQAAEELLMNVPLLARRFDVSVLAMKLRLTTLDILPIWMR